MKYARNHHVTIKAGSSMSQKRIPQTLAVLALLVGLASSAAAQTGQVMPPPKFLAFDANGDPCAGCLLYSYLATTTTPTSTYTSSALSVANANPVVLDSAGRATVFLNSTVSYKFTLKTAAGVDIWTVDNVVGPFAGVVAITAASTRGLTISRASAEAGLSIASTGGSGKTYGIASNTSGALLIRDDADGTPNITISGNDVTTTATGVVATTGNQTISGTLGVTGATTLTGAATLNSTLAVTGAATFASTVTSSSALVASAAAPQVTLIETDGSADNKRWGIVANAEALQILTLNDAASSSAPVMTIDRTGTVVDAVVFSGTAVANAGRYNSAVAQPGFLAYNSAIDSAANGATVDFDTEVYDEAGNFSADTFTAPLTGRYSLCATVYYSDNSASTFGLRIVTSNRTYQIGNELATTAGVANGCVVADMSTGQTATVQVLTGDIDIDIEGGASPLVTFFSGRLVP